MKQFIVSLGVLSLTFAGAAFADTSNSNTGAGSTNNASQETNNQTNISNINDCFFDNDINSGTNTGNNQASGNTGSGSVNTGDTSTDVNVDNNCNEIMAGVVPTGTSTSPSGGESAEVPSGFGVEAASGELPQTLAATGPSSATNVTSSGISFDGWLFCRR